MRGLLHRRRPLGYPQTPGPRAADAGLDARRRARGPRRPFYADARCAPRRALARGFGISGVPFFVLDQR